MGYAYSKRRACKVTAYYLSSSKGERFTTAYKLSTWGMQPEIIGNGAPRVAPSLTGCRRILNE